jgi:hypothetical protein
MATLKKEYLYFSYDYFAPMSAEDDPGTDAHIPIWYTETSRLPDWFCNAPKKYGKVIRVLGSTGNFIDPESGEENQDLPKGIRLCSNLSRDFPTNEFIMMMNNYNSIKEFDVTYSDIQGLYWYLKDGLGRSFPAPGMHLDLVVELEVFIYEL